MLRSITWRYRLSERKKLSFALVKASIATAKLPVKIVLVLSIAVALYGLLFGAIIPPILRVILIKKGPEALHREIALSRLSFNPFTFTINMDSLRIEKVGDGPLLAFDTLRVNFQPLMLVTKTIAFKEIYSSGLKLRATSYGNGKYSFSDLIPPPSDKPKKKGEMPSVKIGRFELRDAGIFYYDGSQKERVTLAEITPISFQINRFSTKVINEGENNYEVELRTPENASLKWRGVVELSPILSSTGDLTLKNLDIPRYLKTIEKKLPFTMKSLKVGASIHYTLKQNDKDMDFLLTKGTLAVDSLALDRAGVNNAMIRIPQGRLSGLSLDPKAGKLLIENINLLGDTIQCELLKNGLVNLGTAFDFSKGFPPQKNPAPKPANPKPFYWQINSLTAQLGAFLFVDSTAPKVVTNRLTSGKIQINSISNYPEKPFTLSISADVNETGRAEVSTKGSSFTPRGNYNFKIKGDKLPLLVETPYFMEPYRMEFLSGTAGGDLDLVYRDGKNGKNEEFSIAGSLSLNDLHLKEEKQKTDILKFKRLLLDKMDFNILANRYRIGAITLDNPSLTIAMDEDGRPNFDSLMKPQPKVVAKVDKKPSSAPALSYQIDRISIKNGLSTIRDLTPLFTFGSRLTDLSGELKNISSDPAKTLTFDFKGRMDRSSRILIKGDMNPLSKKQRMNINVKTVGIQLPSFTPYSATFAGLIIDKGIVRTELDYVIKNDSVKGFNHIVIDNIKFGRSVKSAKAVSLPIKLGVALIKDKDGIIDLKIPVEGSLKDPKFKLRKVVWKIIGDIIVKAATSPFRAIAKLFGNEDEPIDQIAFAPGSNQLDAESLSRLSKIGTTLNSREELALEIRGLTRSEDTLFIKRDQLFKKIQAATGVTIDETISSEASQKALFSYYSTSTGSSSDIFRTSLAAQYESQGVRKKREEIDLETRDSLYTRLLEKEIPSADRLMVLGRERGQNVAIYLQDSAKVDLERLYVLQSRGNESNEIGAVKMEIIAR